MQTATEIEKAFIAAKAFIPESNPEFYCVFDNEGNITISHVEVCNYIRTRIIVNGRRLKW